MLFLRIPIPEQEEYEYGEEKSEGATHDTGDGAKVLLEVDEYHRILLRCSRGEGPQRFASCKRTYMGMYFSFTFFLIRAKHSAEEIRSPLFTYLVAAEAAWSPRTGRSA